MQKREVWVTYLLWFLFGTIGVHKFYLNKFGMGILYIFTGGLFLIGLLVDLFTIPRQVRKYNDSIAK
ncbi:MAG: TM2 domain-containing protein [Victivallaceae bacterium]